MSTLKISAPVDVYHIPAPSGGFTIGVPKLVGTMFVIPMKTEAEGVLTACWVRGAHTLTKAAGFSGAIGAHAYYNFSAGNVTATTTDVFIGTFAAVAANAATSCVVDLVGPRDDRSVQIDAITLNTTHATGNGSDHANVATNTAAVAAIKSAYSLEFVGAAAAGNIDVSSACKKSGITPAVGDIVVMITGQVTATGAGIASPIVGATNFAAALIDDGGTVKLQQIEDANLSANTYTALVIPLAAP